MCAKKYLFLSTCCAVLLLGGCASIPAPAARNPAGPKVASYIRTWPLIQSHGSGPENWSAFGVYGEYINELTIIPARLKKTENTFDGSIFFPSVEDHGAPFYSVWFELSVLKKRYPHLKATVSYGGWEADGFSQICADPAARRRFVENITRVTEKHNLDGVEIDWEYPVGPDDWKVNIVTAPEDRERYVLLLAEIRAALDSLAVKTGKTYLLSVAVPSGEWFTKNNDVAAVSRIVDALKIKTFDLYGGWNETTGHHSNLYKNPADPLQGGGWSIDQAVQAYIRAGVPPSKLYAGIAFFGHSFTGVSDNGTHGLYQKYKTAPRPDGIPWQELKNFLEPDSGFTRYWDDVAKAPYLYDGNTFITYVDPQEIAEIARYIQEKGLGGALIYEYAQDTDGELLKALSESLH